VGFFPVVLVARVSRIEKRGTSTTGERGWPGRPGRREWHFHSGSGVLCWGGKCDRRREEEALVLALAVVLSEGTPEVDEASSFPSITFFWSLALAPAL
jgi:hypothetical protein